MADRQRPRLRTTITIEVPLSVRTIVDDLGRQVLFGPAPKRVVSLVPSDTLSVFDLGCGSALVGRTDYCELPVEGVAKIPSIGGTKNPNLEAIFALDPDLVLANKEENTKADLEKIAQAGFRIVVAFPKRVAEGIGHLARLARIFGVAGDPAVRGLCKAGYETLREAERDLASGGLASVPTFCPIWMDPLMTIHGDTFISDMLAISGATNIFADRERRYPLAADLGNAPPHSPEKVGARDTRYPRVSLDEVVERAPSLVLLPDEPHPFTEEDAAVFRGLAIPAAKDGAVLRTSGKDLCWYGSRSVTGLARVRELVRPFRTARVD